jgi:hypothetical protein
VSYVGLWRGVDRTRNVRACHLRCRPCRFRQTRETLAQTGLLDARIIVQLYLPCAMPANIAIDTSPILAVLLAEPEQEGHGGPATSYSRLTSRPMSSDPACRPTAVRSP